MIKLSCAALVVAFSAAALTVALSDERPGESASQATPLPAAVEKPANPAVTRPSPEDARRQAELLHSTVHAALQSIHQQYYRENEGLPIPAAILKDVFAELEQEQNVKLRWLVVEGQAMNSDHRPRDAFENEAVKALKSGQRAFELAKNGVYRRAGSITLTNQCLKCHVPDRKNTANRTAGLIIAIPVREK